ncbi:MAG: hypothetical protein KC561_01880 [Myxococcales bacterium]|nr:hypothetical protein [Myxococcales bacterium]
MRFRRLQNVKGVELLDGRDMDRYLKEHPTVLYRYKPNTPGFAFLAIMALFSAAFGVFVFLDSETLTPAHWAFVGAGGIVALGITAVVAYWLYYTKIYYLAASDRHLMIGKGAQVVAINWATLDTGSLAFIEDDTGFLRGLALQLPDYRADLKLFSRYAVLANLQGFMSTMLTHMKSVDSDE